MFPTLVNVVPTNVITMGTAILAHGIIVKLKRHSHGKHVVVSKFEKVQDTAKCVN